jgi:hypothetical protein
MESAHVSATGRLSSRGHPPKLSLLNVGARRLSGVVFLQLMLIIHSFGRPLSQLLEDFSKAPGGKDLSKMRAQYEMFVNAVGSKQVTV